MTAARPVPADRPSLPLLDVRELSVCFHLGGRALGAVNGVDFQLALGETLCLLGESGSGKTVTMRALIRLLPSTAQITAPAANRAIAKLAEQIALSGSPMSARPVRQTDSSRS